jgi:hypothetical protein
MIRRPTHKMVGMPKVCHDVYTIYIKFGPRHNQHTTLHAYPPTIPTMRIICLPYIFITFLSFPSQHVTLVVDASNFLIVYEGAIFASVFLISFYLFCSVAHPPLVHTSHKCLLPEYFLLGHLSTGH